VTTEESQFDSLLRQYIFLLFKASRPTVEPVRWVPAATGRGREGSHWHHLVLIYRFSEAVSLHPHVSTLSFTFLWSPSQFCAHSRTLHTLTSLHSPTSPPYRLPVCGLHHSSAHTHTHSTHQYNSVPAGPVTQSSSSP